MSRHIIETVTFRLNGEMSEESFLNSAAEATAFMTARPGFICRRLSRQANGTWIEHVEWASMAEAKDAASSIGKDARARAFLSAIEPGSIVISHSELKVSVG